MSTQEQNAETQHEKSSRLLRQFLDETPMEERQALWENARLRKRIKELEGLVDDAREVIITVMAVIDEDDDHSQASYKEGNDYLRKTGQP